MLIPSLIALTIAVIAVYISFKTAEEIEVVTAVLTDTSSPDTLGFLRT